MKTIKELAESLGISKESVYKKIKFQLKAELKSHVFKGKNGTLVDEVGESLILQSLRRERTADKEESNLDSSVESTVGSLDESASYQPDILLGGQVENPEIISLLKQQLKEKDKQITSLMNLRDEQLCNKDSQIEQLLKINEQLISTFQNEQRIKIAGALQLPKTVNAAAGDDVELSAAGSPKKSFWRRIFNT